MRDEKSTSWLSTRAQIRIMAAGYVAMIAVAIYIQFRIIAWS